MNVNVVSGRKYLFIASVHGTQITNAGSPIVRMRIATSEVARPFQPSYGNLNSGTGFYGSFTYPYTAGSTATVAFDITGESGASALRLAANDASITVVDIGI
jgi:hypothetical protein